METVLAIAFDVIVAIALLAAGWLGGKFVNKTIQQIDRLDSTLKSFLGAAAKYTIFALTIVIVLQQFGVQTASLIAVLGAAGLAIGLALQGTLSNVASGVMLLILRPFNVGDTIISGSITGTVKSLSLFATELATPDNIYIFVPNSNLWSGEIQNLSRNTLRRQDIVFGISYADDINKAFKTIEKAITKDDRILKTKGKEPQIVVANLGASSVDITLRIWSAGADFFPLQVETRKAVKEALDKDGINLAFPTRTVHMVPAQGEKKPAGRKKAA